LEEDELWETDHLGWGDRQAAQGLLLAASEVYKSEGFKTHQDVSTWFLKVNGNGMLRIHGDDQIYGGLTEDIENLVKAFELQGMPCTRENIKIGKPFMLLGRSYKIVKDNKGNLCVLRETVYPKEPLLDLSLTDLDAIKADLAKVRSAWQWVGLGNPYIQCLVASVPPVQLANTILWAKHARDWNMWCEALSSMPPLFQCFRALHGNELTIHTWIDAGEEGYSKVLGDDGEEEVSIRTRLGRKGLLVFVKDAFGNGFIACWKSQRQTRVVRAIGVGEMFAIEDGCDLSSLEADLAEGIGYTVTHVSLYNDHLGNVQLCNKQFQPPDGSSKMKSCKYIRDHIRRNIIDHLLHCDGETNPADPLTKPLHKSSAKAQIILFAYTLGLDWDSVQPLFHMQDVDTMWHSFIDLIHALWI